MISFSICRPKRDIQINYDQMDAIVEAMIRIAIHRTDDV